MQGMVELGDIELNGHIIGDIELNGHITEEAANNFQEIFDELEDWVLVGNNEFETLLEGEEDEVLKKLERIVRNIELRLERGSMMQVAT